MMAVDSIFGMVLSTNQMGMNCNLLRKIIRGFTNELQSSLFELQFISFSHENVAPGIASTANNSSILFLRLITYLKNNLHKIIK